MKVITQTIKFSIILALTMACNADIKENPSLIFNLGDELKMVAWEDLSPNNNQLNFTFKTIDRLECENTLINFTYKYNLSTIHIDLDNITTIGDCIEGESYATTTIPVIHVPEHLNYYKLNIDLKNAINIDGNVVEDNLQYRFSLPENAGLNMEYLTLKKILPFMVWGSISVENEQDQYIINQFNSDLAYLTQENAIASGNYHYFIIDDEGNMEVGDPDIDTQGADFASYIQDDVLAFQSLIEDYRQMHGDRIKISARDWTGKIF